MSTEPMSPESWNFFASVSTALISSAFAAFSAWLTCRSEKKKLHMSLQEEREKMLLQWEHDEAISFDVAFWDMCSAVTRFVKNDSFYRSSALLAVSAVRSRCRGELAQSIDHLFQALSDGSRPQAEQYLSEAIDCKRSGEQHKNI